MAPRTSSSSIRLARDEHALDFVGALAAILANPNQRVVSVMIIDRSESLKGYERPIIEAVNRHLDGIRTPPDGSDQYLMVITFNDNFRVAIPLADAKSVAPMTYYKPEGRTLLYETVYLTLKLFIKAYEGLNDSQRANLKIAFGIFTDGEDNESDRTKFPAKLVELVRRARAMGFEFMNYGFRFDAKTIARQMGMPDDDLHAQSFDKSPAGFEAAQRHYTETTTSFFHDSRFQPGSRTGASR